MSLNVYLTGPEIEVDSKCRECGHVGGVKTTNPEYFNANITHNLNRMAGEAGIYEAVWRPDEHGFDRAEKVGNILADGIALMEREPRRFEVLSAENGWGTYEQFLPWLKKYLAACREFPQAFVRVSR